MLPCSKNDEITSALAFEWLTVMSPHITAIAACSHDHGREMQLKYRNMFRNNYNFEIIKFV